MCQGGLDPKYALGDLDRQVRVARRSVAETEENREPGPGLIGWAVALIARVRSKEVTHG